jgi:hypothetical protein
MKSRTSIPKLRAAIDDPDPSFALAAAHSLDLMHDNSAFEVYYEILNGQRKAKKRPRRLTVGNSARFKKDGDTRF